MKKLLFVLAALTLFIGSTAFAMDIQHFEDRLNGPAVVSNALDSGGSADYTEGYRGRGLALDGKYGLDLGNVGGTFSVSAMVNVTSNGETKTVFFKNMGTKDNQNWTGVLCANGKPTFWATSLNWQARPTTAENSLNKWIHLVYTENNGAAALYVNGEQVSSGTVNAAAGRLYLGATYWEADAITGAVDELQIFDTCLSAAEVRALADGFFNAGSETLFASYEFPSDKLVSDLDLSAVPGGKDVVWTSNNPAVLSPDGVVTRPVQNTPVTLTGTLGSVTREFRFTVLAKPDQVNDRVILSYIFSGDGAVTQDVRPSDYVVDESGNGNHGIVYGGMEGGVFDGVDDYIQLPKGILSGHDEFTIVLRLTPQITKTHQFTFCFGNGTNEYFFLNTSRPGLGNLRAAITTGGSGAEKDLVHTPGIHSGEQADIVITATGSFYKMYLNGELVSAADLGTETSSPLRYIL